MISSQNMNREKLETIAAGIPGLLQWPLLEKVYRALLLLERLSMSGLDFVFKGGTAVMLLLDRPQRFSIDIDIVKEGSIEFETLDNVSREAGFLGVEQQQRQSASGIAKTHYKFFYTPMMPTGIGKETILLDVLQTDPPYPQLQDTPVALSLFPDLGEVVSVKTPTIDDICGDKLTAFAPNTLGIPYEKSGESATLEIVKQLFDIGHLFEKVSDLGAVRSSYIEVGRREAEYREGAYSLRQSLEDTLQTALVISTEGAMGVGNYPELRKGIDGVRQFVFSYKFGVSHAVTYAARTAYLAACILYGESTIERYNVSMNLQPLSAGKKPLNTLKKSNPEAFYYWHLIEQLKRDREPIFFEQIQQN